MFGNKLDYAKWRTWSEDEQRAVTAFLRAQWQRFLDEPTGQDVTLGSDFEARLSEGKARRRAALLAARPRPRPARLHRRRP